MKPSILFGRVAAIAGVALLAASLSACGRKDDPRPPEGTPNTYPQQYPNPNL